MRIALIEIVVVLVFGLLFLGLVVTLLVFLVRALKTYIRSHSQPKDPAPAPAPSKTLAQALKGHRTR